ncbi:MAG: hypothetical protein S4CHLAM102_03220 [Chlamydiia bacterium]|nr:hypothetical protein [Chlamydiia bacterium]
MKWIFCSLLFVVSSFGWAEDAKGQTSNSPHELMDDDPGQPEVQKPDPTSMKIDSLETDIKDLKSYIKARRQITIREKGGNLSISGDARTKFSAASEKLDGVKQRGPGGQYPNQPTNLFNVTFNLFFNYLSERTWMNIRMTFNNIAGTINGTANAIKLDRAFIGARVLVGDTYTGDFEFGRRKLDYTFDSRIQFAARMDGILIKYSQAAEGWGDFYLNGGPFLIEDSSSRFAYVFEAGVLNIARTGLFAKYSFIDWDTRDFSDPALAAKYAFINNQITLGYSFMSPWIKKRVVFYSAGLINAAAKGIPQTHNRKENYAWYAGFTLGDLRKRNDWTVNANIQWVLPQAVPQFDVNGIGTGNAGNSGFYTNNANGTGGITTAATANGNTNYWGWTAEFLYLFTDNMTVSQSWEQSTRLRSDIGQPFFYKKYKLEIVYAY